MKANSYYNKILYNLDNTFKVNTFNYSKITTINKTQNSDSNNINNETSLFTNEILKSIANSHNNTSPYNSFLRKVKIMPNPLLHKENNNLKKKLFINII